MGRVFDRALRWAVAGVAALALLSFAQSVHPFFDSLSHFRLHMAVLLGAGAVLLFLRRDGAAALPVLLVAAAALAMTGPALQRAEPVPEADLTLLQFNTRFDNATPRAIIAEVEAFRPDVVTLQEVSPNTSVILEQLQQAYPYQLSCPFSGVGGVAVLSRHRFTAQHCKAGAGLAWARIDLGRGEVSVASLHLHWPWPHGQAQQVAAFIPVLAALPAPVVIAGDFNAAPWSAAVTRLAAASGTAVAPGLRFTFKRTLPGLGSVPVLPIDHVLVSTGASAEITPGKDAGSDHLPLLARIRF